MLEWLTENSKVIGACITVVVGASGLIKKLFGSKESQQSLQPTNSNHNTLIVNNNIDIKKEDKEDKEPMDSDAELNRLKGLTRILFIDDDTKFKVVSILKKSGWMHTKMIKDIEYLECPEAREANIFFVDIQGVGISLNFNDEGLGLALALKQKYPNKKLVIYSTERKGERFHEALRKADTFLPKNAEPYEFLQIVEQFSADIFSRKND